MILHEAEAPHPDAHGDPRRERAAAALAVGGGGAPPAASQADRRGARRLRAGARGGDDDGGGAALAGLAARQPLAGGAQALDAGGGVEDALDEQRVARGALGDDLDPREGGGGAHRGAGVAVEAVEERDALG